MSQRQILPPPSPGKVIKIHLQLICLNSMRTRPIYRALVAFLSGVVGLMGGSSVPATD